MKALVCREHGMPDKLDLVSDWPEPEAGEHDVVIDVRAAGLNFPDVLIIQGKYQFQPELPFVVGSECAGIVEAVGDKVTRYQPGDEVISMGGGFRDQAVCNEAIVFPKPKALSFEEAAGIAITYFTARYKEYVGRETESPSLIASGYHSRMDLYASILVVVSLAVSALGLGALDRIAAAVIILFVILAGWEIASSALRALLSGGFPHMEEDLAQVRRHTRRLGPGMHEHLAGAPQGGLNDF